MANLLCLIDNEGNYFTDCLDPLNLNKTRTISNTSRDSYNCFGYAFNIYNWAAPFPSYDFLDEAKEMAEMIQCEYYDNNKLPKEVADTYNNLDDKFFDFVNDRILEELDCYKDDDYAKQMLNEIFYYSNYSMPLIPKICINHILATLKM